MQQIRILMVDDHPKFLAAAVRFLAMYPQVEIVGQLHSGCEVLQQLPLLRPDLILMDWDLPDTSGLELTRCIKAQPNAPHIIMLALYKGPIFRVWAKAAQADGFVCKSDFGKELLPLIHRLFAGPAPNGSVTPGGTNDSVL